MNSIDQYYVTARRELETLADRLAAEAQQMKAGEHKHPFNRPLPTAVLDAPKVLATIQRMMTRFNLLCELGIENLSGCFPDTVTTTPMSHPRVRAVATPITVLKAGPRANTLEPATLEGTNR